MDIYDQITKNFGEKMGLTVACRALQRIKEVLEDESLDDADCFWKIEAVVETLEQVGSDGGNRHDF